MKYLCSAFVDAGSIEATPDVMKQLLDLLEDDSLEAITVSEGPPAPGKNRILLKKKDDSWQLLLGSTRFDVTLLLKLEDKGRMQSFKVFCKNSGGTLGKCLAHFGRLAHRVSAVRDGFLREMPASEMNTIAKRLLKLPPDLGPNVPYEWNWRCVYEVEKRLSRKKEAINTIAVIKRASGRWRSPKTDSGDLEEFDRISVQLDVNTFPTNIIPRFGQKGLREFCGKAPRWQKEVYDAIFRSMLRLNRDV